MLKCYENIYNSNHNGIGINQFCFSGHRKNIWWSGVGTKTEEGRYYSPDGKYQGKEVDGRYYSNDGKYVGKQDGDRYYSSDGSYRGKEVNGRLYNTTGKYKGSKR